MSDKTIDRLTERAGHTRGPWQIAGHLIVAEVDATTIAQLPLRFATEANARLIAAAPDLLEACKRAKKLLQPEVTKEPDRTIFWQLVRAIKLAEEKTP